MEADRARFIDLFGDDTFMVFSEVGPLSRKAATVRFDWMLALCNELPFAKQAVIERSTGATIGYAGVDYFDYRGEPRLEFGYRFITGARGRGYATEASEALLALARESWHGDLLAFIDPQNGRSRNVLGKLGFTLVERTVIRRQDAEVYSLTL
jgi:RimJ/RimL family protein N-acetyltransferase